MKKATDGHLLDKVLQYEKILEELKKKYQREMILNKALETANSELERNCNNLEVIIGFMFLELNLNPY